MKLSQLKTPMILLDLDALEKNIRGCASLCSSAGKHLWPMVKTHKSTALARMQRAAGADGFLCGTLDECEALLNAGLGPVMYAYPPAGEVNLRRSASLAASGHIVFRLDSFEAARALSDALVQAGAEAEYTIIIDSGLHRLGVPPCGCGELYRRISVLPGLKFIGISTHPGHVYSAINAEDVKIAAAGEHEAIREAIRSLGFTPPHVGTGSTPTAPMEADFPEVTHMHPGNYVFMDRNQIINGTALEGDCALTVLATVISNPAPGLYIIDAGAKCLGLDQGGHGNSAVKGFGRIIGMEDAVIESLSEEVGKVRAEGLGVGQRIRIIPNHSCSTANLTGWYTCIRGDEAVSLIEVDIRGNSNKPVID